MKPLGKITKTIIFGLFTWTIPFFSSFVFFNAQGEILIDQFLFESIITTYFVFILLLFTYLFFRKTKLNSKDLFRLAWVWFIINVVLDFLVLIPFAGMTFADWFSRIGIRYAIIPFILVGFGLLLKKK